MDLNGAIDQSVIFIQGVDDNCGIVQLSNLCVFQDQNLVVFRCNHGISHNDVGNA
jgi:hypothetical protein